MSYNRLQFEVAIRKTLSNMGENFTSESAIKLLLGTAAHESKFGHYLWQVKGPALGAFQIEPATFYWLRNVFAPISYLKKDIPKEDLIYDLRISIIVARLRYWVVPSPLPDKNDVLGLAWYWKKYYNTFKGAGKPEQFVKACKDFNV